MKHTLRRSVLVCLLNFLSLGVIASAAEQPNIVVIYTDDHGYADLGIHGVVQDIRTPNLDALGRSGVVARHGYTTAPQCVPSRAGLMVGKFQGRFNLDNNGSSLNGFNKETTIATRLQNAGYVTAQFGKWHLGPTEEIASHGFKHVFAQNAQRPFSANITLDGQDRPMGDLRPEMYHIEGCSRAAASIIERYKEQPFFLYIAFRAPHTPLDAPAKYTSRFVGEMPERRRQALAMLSAVDDGVGRITGTLNRLGLTERTLIFFIGDNGAPLKIHKIDAPLKGDPGGWDGSLNIPLNGEKGMLAEGGMHVPFLIAWPDTIPGGQTYDQPISALDVAATAAAVANVKVSSGDLDGVNLVPHLRGEIKSPPHDALYWRWTAQSAIREGNWKLLRGGDREYLYDLGADLEEKHNLAAEHPDIANRLRAKLKAWGDGLNPPGLALAPMAKAWTEYFDYYLDRKKLAKPEATPKTAAVPATPVAGWQVRNGTLVAKDDGILELRSDKGPQGKGTFITRSELKLASPATVKLTLKTAAAGPASVAWRSEGDKGFLPTNRATFQVIASGDWQSHEIQLPASRPIVHVRVHLPAGTSLIREIKLNP